MRYGGALARERLPPHGGGGAPASHIQGYSAKRGSVRELQMTGWRLLSCLRLPPPPRLPPLSIVNNGVICSGCRLRANVCLACIYYAQPITLHP